MARDYRKACCINKTKRLSGFQPHLANLEVSSLKKSIMGHSLLMYSAPVSNNVRCYSNSDQNGDMPRTTLSANSGHQLTQEIQRGSGVRDASALGHAFDAQAMWAAARVVPNATLHTDPESGVTRRQ